LFAPHPTSRSTLFPYTTLFRSCGRWPRRRSQVCASYGGKPKHKGCARSLVHECERAAMGLCDHEPDREAETGAPRVPAGREERRSEEHTSELQSRENLVCRLLL